MDVGPAGIVAALSVVWRTLITAWSWGIFVGAVVVCALIVLPATMLGARLWPPARHWLTAGVRSAVGLYVRLLPFIRLEVDETNRVPEESRILVVNHQSFIDPLIVYALEKRVAGPARGYLMRTPFLGPYLEFAGFYVTDRGQPAPLDEMRRATRRTIEEGGSLLFYPEGTRSKSGEIATFGAGAFRIAAELDLPIQPIVIEGLDRAYPPGSILVKTLWRYPVRVRYLEPVRPPFGDGSQRQVVRALAERVRSTMIASLQQMRSRR